MMDGRNIVITGVLVLCSAGAFWLARDNAASAVAPAQVMAQEFKVAPVETGRVVAVMVTPGQRVAGGQVIARLDTAVLEREVAVAEARLRALGSETQASSAALESEGYHSERSFQTDLDEASAQFDSARAQYAREAAELKQLREELQRQREYLKEGLVRRDRFDELELRQKTLEDTVAGWPGRIEALSARVRSTRGRLEDWTSRYSASSALKPKDVRVAPARQRVNEQLETLRVLKARIDSAIILAPADGEVVSVLARPGDVVRAGDPFVVVNGTGPRQVVAYVNEHDGRALQPGHVARLQRRTTTREQYEAKVVRVADTVSPLPTRFWVSPQLASYGREVVLDFPANAKLVVGEALDVTFASGGRS